MPNLVNWQENSFTNRAPQTQKVTMKAVTIVAEPQFPCRVCEWTGNGGTGPVVVKATNRGH